MDESVADSIDKSHLMELRLLDKKNSISEMISKNDARLRKLKMKSVDVDLQMKHTYGHLAMLKPIFCFLLICLTLMTAMTIPKKHEQPPPVEPVEPALIDVDPVDEPKDEEKSVEEEPLEEDPILVDYETFELPDFSGLPIKIVEVP